jgi:hypothetical protein
LYVLYARLLISLLETKDPIADNAPSSDVWPRIEM